MALVDFLVRQGLSPWEERNGRYERPVQQQRGVDQLEIDIGRFELVQDVE